MRSGALRNLILIEERFEAGRNDSNEEIWDWRPWGEVFSEVTTRRGTEHFDVTTKQRFSQVVYRFRCRRSDIENIETSMRIQHDGQLYDIKSLLPDEQRREDVIIEATLQDGAV